MRRAPTHARKSDFTQRYQALKYRNVSCNFLFNQRMLPNCVILDGRQSAKTEEPLIVEL